jgi:hypothetical protein
MKKAAKSKTKKVVKEEVVLESQVVEEIKPEEIQETPKQSLFERALGKGNNYTVMTESASAISDNLRKVKTGKYDDSCVHRMKK